MSIVAKFTCQSVTSYEGAERVDLHAAHGSGNESWAKATPGGNLQITISNPEARGRFEPGKSYMLTIAAPAALPAAPKDWLSSITGEVGFEAYGGAGPNPWKTYNGGEMPRWPSLEATTAGLATRERWAAAGRAEIIAFLAAHGFECIPADTFANTPSRIAPIATKRAPAITTSGNAG